MSETATTKKRQRFLDRLRVFATCAVVMLHTITGVMDTTDMSLYPVQKTVFLVALDLLTWCVPVFVMISGYLFLHPDRKPTLRTMLFRYCRRIVFALFLFGVPYAVLEQIATTGNVSAGMIGKAFHMVCTGQSWSHMWYLYLILVLYVATPAMKWMLERMPRPALYTILTILVVGSSLLTYLRKLFGWDGLISMPDAGIYFFYYICGGLLAEKTSSSGTDTGSGKLLEHIRRSPSERRAALAITVLLAGMIASRLVGSYSVQMAYNYPFTVVLVLLSVWLASRLEDCMQTEKGWSALSELCFCVYLIHPLFINILYKFLHITPLDFPIGLSLPLFFLAVLIPSVLVSFLLHKIGILRKYVL